MANRPHSFPKSEHLCSKKAITELFENGKQVFVHPVRCIYMPYAGTGATQVETPATQVLVSVSKRLHKKAVTRALLKRRLREAYRTHKTPETMSGISRMALIYISQEVSSFQQIENAIGKILCKIAPDR